MPYNLYLEPAGENDLDTRLNNRENFYYWCASRVLTLSCFHRVTQDDYRLLLHHLLETDHIQRTEQGGLILGLAGERVVSQYKFYAVFQENIEYTVHAGSEQLGTIVKPPPVGDKMAIAGRVWVVD